MADSLRTPNSELRTSHDPIAIALAEDIGPGDLTSRYFTGTGRKNARIFAKEPCIAAGLATGAEVFRRVDPQLGVGVVCAEGSALEIGDTVLEITGPVRSILTAERVALNFIQRLSGVATLTRRFVDAVAGTPARILDTRKTTPGLRALEKAAVIAGGGTNHRFGLFDMVMVKDNHLVAEGGPEALQAAILKLKSEKPEVEVELEADNLEQVRIFLTMEGVDYVLLDNMSVEELSEAIEMRGDRSKPLFEASGGITLGTLREIAKTGVDFISVGALTHSAPALDLGLDFETL